MPSTANRERIYKQIKFNRFGYCVEQFLTIIDMFLAVSLNKEQSMCCSVNVTLPFLYIFMFLYIYISAPVLQVIKRDLWISRHRR